MTNKPYTWWLDYWLIIIATILELALIIFTLTYDPIKNNSLKWIFPIISGIILILICIKDLRGKHKERQDDTKSKLRDENINTIRKELMDTKTKLMYKIDIFKEFLDEGVVNDEDILDNLSQEPFTILYHYNKDILKVKGIEKFLPQKKKVMKIILEELNFVPVGFSYGAHFFHVVNTHQLPKELQNISCLEEYIRKRVVMIWNEIWDNIQKNDPSLYKQYETEKNKKLNLSYFLGNIFPPNLSVGYINSSSFDTQFLAYYTQFINMNSIRINTQKLNELNSRASIRFLIKSMEPKDRQIIVYNEKTLKKDLGINKITDYASITKETWNLIFQDIFQNVSKSQKYANDVYQKAQEYCPIIEEFL